MVVGGGLLGVATAFELARRNVPSVLLEARDELAAGSSFANGAMLTPSMPDPWNGPGVGRHLAASLFDPRSPMKLHVGAIPGLARWGIGFLRNSRAARHSAATLANYRLAAHSLAHTRALRDELQLDYDAATRGTMKVFADSVSMAGPLALARQLQPLGLQVNVLDRDGALAMEPQLAAAGHHIGGALHYPQDEVGDARRFTLQLADHARRLGVAVRCGVRVTGLAVEGGRVVGVHTSAGDHTGAVIIAGGVDSPRLVRQIGVRLPIAPAKGYSLTIDATALGDRAPRLPVIDDAMHAAVVPLGKRLRLVGTAEFAGHDTRIDQVRIDNLRHLFRRLYPQLAAELPAAGGQAWAGLRPMSSDGVPFIGPSATAGLWLNCGHGHLGWTMAAGSAQLLAAQFTGQPGELDPAPYRHPR